MQSTRTYTQARQRAGDSLLLFPSWRLIQDTHSLYLWTLTTRSSEEFIDDTTSYTWWLYLEKYCHLKYKIIASTIHEFLQFFPLSYCQWVSCQLEASKMYIWLPFLHASCSCGGGPSQHDQQYCRRGSQTAGKYIERKKERDTAIHGYSCLLYTSPSPRD